MKIDIQKELSKPVYQYVLLSLITLLAAVLRFYKLGEWSFWIDEIYTILRSQAQYSNLNLLIQSFSRTIWLPLSVVLTGGVLNILHVNEWNARLISAIIGVISIPILYIPTKRLFGWRAGLIAALLLAVSTWHIYWSQNARFYSSLLLFYTLALFLFFLWIENDRFIYLISFFLLLYLSTSERLFAIFILPVIACYLFFLWILPVETPRGFRKRNIIFLLVLFVAGVIFEGLHYLMRGNFRFFGDYSWFFLYRVDDPFRMFSIIGFNIGFPLMVFAFFGGVYLILRRNRAGLLFFMGAVIPVLLLLIINPFVFTKDRYVFVTLTSWIILGAVAIKEIFNQTKDYGKVLALGILLLFIVDAAGANLMYYQVNNGNRRDWKGVFRAIENKSEEGDIYVSYWPELGEYYLNEEVVFWEDVHEDVVINNDHRYWFVLDSETIWGNKPMKKWVEENAELIEVRYLRTTDDLYLRIYLYDPAVRTTAE